MVDIYSELSSFAEDEEEEERCVRTIASLLEEILARDVTVISRMLRYAF